MKIWMKQLSLVGVFCGALSGTMLSLSATASADEVCRPCPFSCEYTGISPKDCSNRGGSRGMCCVDLDNRGQDRLRELEQNRYGSGGYNNGYGNNGYGSNSYGNNGYGNNGGYGGGNWNGGWGNRPPRNPYPNGQQYGWGQPPRRNDPGAYDDRYGYNPGDCPPGFHVNDRTCTPEERRQGCNDMRSPSGQTCVGWHQRRR